MKCTWRQQIHVTPDLHTPTSPFEWESSHDTHIFTHSQHVTALSFDCKECQLEVGPTLTKQLNAAIMTLL